MAQQHFHLPVRPTGDGGVCTTVGDVAGFWKAFIDGRIVSEEWVQRMIQPRYLIPDEDAEWSGIGFDIHDSPEHLIGIDAGVSFWSGHDTATDTTFTVMSNTTNGAWPVGRRLWDLLR